MALSSAFGFTGVRGEFVFGRLDSSRGAGRGAGAGAPFHQRWSVTRGGGTRVFAPINSCPLDAARIGVEPLRPRTVPSADSSPRTGT